MARNSDLAYSLPVSMPTWNWFNRRLPGTTQRDEFTVWLLQSVVGGYRFAMRVDVPGSRLFSTRLGGTRYEGKVGRVAGYMPERLPSRPLGIQTFVLRSAIFEDSLPDVASRPVRRSFLEPERQGEVGSLRRRGEVGRTTTSTRTICRSDASPGSCLIPPADQRNLFPRDLDAVAGF